MSNLPRVRVIMPVYNHAPYVQAAMQSVLRQQGVQIELIVIDDASSDASWERIQEINREINNPRLRCFRHSHNLGAHASLNEGIKLAQELAQNSTQESAQESDQSDWLAIINSDDIFHPERLQRCITLMQAQQLDLVGSDITLMNAAGENIQQHWWLDAFADLKQRQQSGQDLASTLLYGNVFMTTSNMVLRREAAARLGEFSAERYVHDYDYLLRALETGLRIGWLDEPLLRYRLHESNTISAQPLAANRECAAMLRRHLPALRPFLAEAQHGAMRLNALGEQWARMDRYVDEIWAALQHHALVAKEAELFPLITERDQLIAQRDIWVRERDTWISDRDQWIAERDQRLAQQDVQLQQSHAQLNALQNEQQQLQQQLAQHQASRSYRFARLLGLPWRITRRLAHTVLRTDYAKLGQRVRHFFSLPALPARHDLQRASSIEALRQQLATLPPEVVCVSFDVFDTLMARCIEPPESLQQRVCAKLATHLSTHWGMALQTETIWQARQAVERELRESCLREGGDYECHFQPLLARWVERLLGHEDAALQAWIEACEQQLEALALIAKPGMRELLHELKTRGLRLIAVSDMYLGETHIRALLHNAGLGELINQLYVSAEYGVGKYSTRLHAHVLQSEALDAAQIVHVGDNLHSDMLAPLQLGMQGIFLDEAAERIRRRQQSLSADMVRHSGKTQSVWHGRQFFEIVEQRQHLKQEQLPPEASGEHAFFYRYGRDVLGPAFTGFTLGLVERLRAWKADKVFFLARDGYLFQQLYHAWSALEQSNEAPLNDPLPEAVYAYASRRVVASAAIAEGMSHEQALVGLYNPKQHGLLSILKTYGLKTEDFVPHAEQHGLSPIDSPLHDWHDPRLLAFLADEGVQTRIRRFGQQARADLEAYFAQLGFFSSQRIALVDIGWSGTIQKFLGQAFAQRSDYPEVRGYYFAFVGQMHTDFAPNAAEGLLSDARLQNPCENIPGEFEEIFEQGARALEATTLGYQRQNDGRITPILKDDSAADRQEELRCNPMVAAMQQGALDLLPHVFAAAELTGYRFAQIKPYLQAVLERAVAYPSAEEISHISRLAHSEDFGHDHTLDISNQHLRWWHILRHPRRFMHELRIAPWRYAMLARLPAPIPSLYRLLWLRNKK